MRKSIASELRMLRMMMWHFGIETECHFCHKPLLNVETLLEWDGDLHFGGQALPPIKEKLTIHHADGNHHNNEPSNRKPCHSTCHKSWHMKQRRTGMSVVISPRYPIPYVVVDCNGENRHLAESINDVLGGIATPRKSICGRGVVSLLKGQQFNAKIDCQSCRKIQESLA